MEVVEGLHFIECPFGKTGYFTSVCALVGEKVALVDAGMPDSPTEAIFPYLKELGKEPSEVSYILLTHGHFDHCAGIQAVLRVSEAKVAVHEADKPFIEDPGLIDRELHTRFPSSFPKDAKPAFEPIEVDVTLRDGDKVSLGDRELEVLHIPGHSPGSTCLIDRRRGVYISGDSVQGRGENRPLLFHSTAAYTDSMKRLSSEPMRYLLLGHPFPPFARGVLERASAETHVSESLLAVQELRDKVLNLLKSTAEPQSLSEVHEKLPGSRVSSVGCVLEDLVAEGKAEKTCVAEDYLWRSL